MKKILALLITLVAVTVNAEAFVGSSLGTVHISSKYAGINDFKCHNKIYYSDIRMPKYHGCDSEPIGYGQGGLRANIITAYYDGQNIRQQNASADKDNAKTLQTQTFIEKPDGELYRITDMTFLNSPRLHYFFNRAVGLTGKGLTNIILERFSQRNLQSYGNNFCVSYHLKYPFQGIFGWCQNDRFIDGEVGYLKGSMTFTRAALLVQNYIYDENLQVEDNKLLNSNSITALNIGKNGWLYYAFGTRAQLPNDRNGAYSFRVYFNGRIELREHYELSSDADEL